MNKKLRLVILSAVAILMITVLIFALRTPTSERQFIQADDVYDQEGNYFVYFWQEECGYCQEIEEEIQAYEENGSIPLYVVDMTEADNLKLWYDWETHHEKNDVIIGSIEDGEEIYEKDPDVFLNNPDVQYDIKIVDEKIIAQHQTAFFNPYPTDIETLDIVTTPALLYVSDTPELVAGVDNTLTMLKQYNN